LTACRIRWHIHYYKHQRIKLTLKGPSPVQYRIQPDSLYPESLLRTLKYRPDLSVKPFETLLETRRRATGRVHWYNEERRHSGFGSSSSRCRTTWH
jgi:transposase InsO family protein